MIEKRYTQNLQHILKEQVSGKEKHHLYHKWIDQEIKIVETHSRHLIPDIEQFVDLSDKYILDFGCGTAGSSVALALRGARVIGIEPNFLSIEAANIRIKGHHLENKIKVFHLEDTSRLPFKDEHFDVCVSYSVLEYINKDRRQYLREMWRVLKKNGILFIGGTSNGIYPMEMHGKVWFVNYFPKLAKKHNLIYGSNYWEIISSLKPSIFSVMNKFNKPDGLDRFIQRMSSCSLTNMHLVQQKFLILILRFFRISICSLFDIPIDAFLPWLNICLKKCKS